MCRLRICVMVLGLIFLLCGACPVMLAQTSTEGSAADLEKRVKDLEKQLDTLRSELSTMKGKSAEAPAPAATAQPAAAAAPADPLSGISSVIGGSTVVGLVDGYYTYNVNQPASHTSVGRPFDSTTNQFSLNLIEVGLVKAPDANSRLGYNATLGFGNAMKAVNGADGDASFTQYVKEAYLSYLAPVGKGLQIDFGKYVTPAGAEVIETSGNWNYTRGILFYNAIPYYHFGLRAKYTFNDKFALTGYVTNGWNNIAGYSNSNGKTGGITAAFNVTKKLSISENWLGGYGALASDNDSFRNLSDTVITYNATSKLSFMVNGDYGRVHFATPLDYYGVAGYIKYQANPKWAFATRYEYFNDPDGVQTGMLGHVQGVTGTIERRIAQHLITRLEYRHDEANSSIFTKGAATPVTGQSTVTGGLTFVFEPPR